MPEIVLELSLNRSSGVLAGIVASLAQAGIELKSQKLQRATEGRGGWLTIVGSGGSPEPTALAERLDGTRGVEKLMRVVVDGEAVLAEGKPLDDQIRHGDLAELSAGSDSGPDENAEAPELPASPDRNAGQPTDERDIEDLPLRSEPEPMDDAPTESEPGRRGAALEAVAERVEKNLETTRCNAEESPDDYESTELNAEPAAESDLSDALRGGEVTAETDDACMANGEDREDSDPAQVGAVLRRRRRRRR